MFDHEALRRASAQYKTTLRETSCDDKNRGRGAAANDPKRRVNQAPGYGAIQDSVMARSKESSVRHPKHLRGIGNSVEGVFVRDCNLCDMSDFETVIQRVVSA